MDEKFYLIGYASGVAGADIHSGDGPVILQHSSYLKALEKKEDLSFEWAAMITPPESILMPEEEAVYHMCESLAKKVSALVKENKLFCVLGGDHTCAIGTWSGVFDAIYPKSDLGLIWLDAHMDSHTPETTESGRIHGMPLASLLGYGYQNLTSILHKQPKLKPENVCLIGVRNYEKGEAELLKQLNVRIYFMDEIKERGYATIFKEAVEKVSLNTIGYGISLDLDSIDPKEAPGVDVPEPDGLHAVDVMEGLASIQNDPRLISTEIVEFDPLRDINHMTEKLIVSFLNILTQKRSFAKQAIRF